MKISELSKGIAQGRARFYISRGDGFNTEYMRSDGKWFLGMDASRVAGSSGGTYFETHEDAQSAIDAIKEIGMKLEVGKTYYDPDDDVECTITEHDPSDNTYRSDTDCWFHDDGRLMGGDYFLQPATATQARPITFLSDVDALAEEHGLTVMECSICEGVYTLIVTGD